MLISLINRHFNQLDRFCQAPLALVILKKLAKNTGDTYKGSVSKPRQGIDTRLFKYIT